MAASVWNPDNIRDVAEALGIPPLSQEVVDHVTRDVEFRLSQVLEEAIKFMRHARRTTLHIDDVTAGLRVLNVEPLYGYETTRPVKFGEASIGPGQPLYYIEDEEVDFEKLINAPLPKVPREITFTGHWLAVEGVQPTIPQNPAPADSQRTTNDLLPRGPGASSHLAATAGSDNVTVKTMVKHVVSKELQLYFENVCAALLDDQNEAARSAAIASLSNDPGLHQLTPYLVQFVNEKVTHNLRSLFTLTQMMHTVAALLQNAHLYMTPYVASLIPPVLTCLIGKRLGPADAALASSTSLPAHLELRNLASSVIAALVAPRFADAIETLKPRLARAFLKHFLSPNKEPLGVYCGVIVGMRQMLDGAGIRRFVIPNLAVLDEPLRDALRTADSENTSTTADPETNGHASASLIKAREVDALIAAVAGALDIVAAEKGRNRHGGGDAIITDEERARVAERVGSEVLAEKLCGLGRKDLVDVLLEDE